MMGQKVFTLKTLESTENKKFRGKERGRGIKRPQLSMVAASQQVLVGD